MRMSYIKLYDLLHGLPLTKFDYTTHSQARVSKVHFRVHLFFWFFNPVFVINYMGLLLFHNFFRLKNNFEKVVPTRPVRMTEHCQHFEMFLDSAGYGPLWQE